MTSIIIIGLLFQVFITSCVSVQRTESVPVSVVSSPEVVEPTMKVNIIPTENKPTSLNIENQAWRLYLFLDPYAPPFKSRLIEVSFDLRNTATPMANTVIIDDDVFLGRENYLSWDPLFSKAIFRNQDGLFLFDPEDNTFSAINAELASGQELYWNQDGSSIAYMTQNEHIYSGDILLVNVETASVKRFEFQKDKLPRLIGWMGEKELLVSIDEMGYEDCLKGCVVGRELALLDVNTGALTDYLAEEDWLHTESIQLSPSARWLTYIKTQDRANAGSFAKTMCVNLQTQQVEKVNIDSGLLKWINDESFVIYEPSGENTTLNWYENWSPVQEIKIPVGFEISEIIATPDKNALAVFLTLSRSYPGTDLVPVGYEAYILNKDGSKREFLLQGYNPSEWTVRYAAFLPFSK